MMFRSGDIVLVPFPFTDLTAAKRRPALLLAALSEFGDWLCLPVTTQGQHHQSIALEAADFAGDVLPRLSWVRANRPTILAEEIMLGRIASLRPGPLGAIRQSMCLALSCGPCFTSEANASDYGAGEAGQGSRSV